MGVSRDWPHFLGTPYYLGKGKATDYKFGGYIYRVNLNKNLLKISEKGSEGVSRDCPNFWGTPYYLRNG